MTLEESLAARLQAQMNRADVVLFTGAGFSAAAQDPTGRTLPTGSVLTTELWAWGSILVAMLCWACSPSPRRPPPTARRWCERG